MTYMTADDFQAASNIENYRKVIRRIAGEVSEATGIRVSAIYGPSQRAKDCRARELVCFIAYRQGFSLAEIGEALARHHTTILHAIGNERTRREEAGE